jgi:hypothetical protein
MSQSTASDGWDSTAPDHVERTGGRPGEVYDAVVIQDTIHDTFHMLFVALMAAALMIEDWTTRNDYICLRYNSKLFRSLFMLLHSVFSVHALSRRKGLGLKSNSRHAHLLIH